MNPSRNLAESYVPAGSPGCNHRLYSHAVQFYFDDQVLVRFTSEFVATALLAGDGAVILATNEHQHAVAEQLYRRDIDVAAYIERGLFVALDANEALSECLSSGSADFSRFRQRVSRVLAGVNAAATIADPRAMVFGELVSLLWERRDCAALLALEDVWENLAQEFSFTLFCGYSIKEFCEGGAEDIFLKVCNKHSTIVPPDQYSTDESERRILTASARPQATC